MADLWIFVSALAVAYLMPGPDMVLLLQTGATEGRRYALAATIGLAIARAAHVLLAALGLAALLRTAPLVFDIVRLAGALYLVWLAIGILRAPTLAPSADGGPESTTDSYGGAVRRGLLTNILNPKALLFCSVLLPQFIHAGDGNEFEQFLMLGAILVATGIAFDTLYALSGAGLGRLIARHRRAELAQRWIFATLLAGFGARVALLAR